ncbi:hypothetical protein A2U01_0052789, partial [Trifolium medium]|nr:hypothetical protein [Trifolium medium]
KYHKHSPSFSLGRALPLPSPNPHKVFISPPNQSISSSLEP